MNGPLVHPDDAPAWLRGLVEVSGSVDTTTFTRFTVPRAADARPAAVLVLLGSGGHGTGNPGGIASPDGHRADENRADEQDPDVLLLRRADTLGAHAGQVAFPGGGAEDVDAGPVDTALREAREETGVDPSGVRPVALLPELYVPVSGFAVTPVLAHWHRPSPVHPVDYRETAAVARVPVAELADPANRFQVRKPGGGWYGPAFEVGGLFVWGFTAGLLSVLLELGGWAREWDTTDVRDLDVALAAYDARVGPGRAERARSGE
ncbi:NUDIX hydrolase [Saccharomonospora iraqiensis]|uniref:NUDIX hydrolase n=1 Tax=Saccharomonospora iraqiensis TaxID=52698 RepID=UPI0004181F0D|nr:CoA pyrophosphatase [Saccharomonospora iraqiensis]